MDEETIDQQLRKHAQEGISHMESIYKTYLSGSYAEAEDKIKKLLYHLKIGELVAQTGKPFKDITQEEANRLPSGIMGNKGVDSLLEDEENQENVHKKIAIMEAFFWGYNGVPYNNFPRELSIFGATAVIQEQIDRPRITKVNLYRAFDPSKEVKTGEVNMKGHGVMYYDTSIPRLDSQQRYDVLGGCHQSIIQCLKRIKVPQKREETNQHSPRDNLWQCNSTTEWKALMKKILVSS